MPTPQNWELFEDDMDVESLLESNEGFHLYWQRIDLTGKNCKAAKAKRTRDMPVVVARAAKTGGRKDEVDTDDEQPPPKRAKPAAKKGTRGGRKGAKK
jgi:hypothetical protein